MLGWLSKTGEAAKEAGGSLAGKMNIGDETYHGPPVTGGEQGGDKRKNSLLVEGLKINEEDAFNKLQRRRAAEKREKSYSGSITTLNTLLAITDVKVRKRIATKRIKSLKCTIHCLFFLAFILAGGYVYLLVLMYNDDGMTLGRGLVEKHVRGTAQFEIGLELWLFILGFFRLRFPKKEGIYYLTQISYLFAVIHYLILVPLNARNFYKHLSQLDEMMRTTMALGRCSKVEVVVPSKSTYETKTLIRDGSGRDHACILEVRTLNLPHIRPVTQRECDGDKTWYRNASALAFDRGHDPNVPIKYEVYATTFAWSQKKHRCCGIKSMKDWIKTESTFYNDVKASKQFDESKFVYPESCCKPEWRREHPDDNCYEENVFGGVCTSDEQVTVITFSLSLLVVLILCAILNLTILVSLTKYRNLVERFRPDLLER